MKKSVSAMSVGVLLLAFSFASASVCATIERSDGVGAVASSSSNGSWNPYEDFNESFAVTGSELFPGYADGSPRALANPYEALGPVFAVNESELFPGYAEPSSSARASPNPYIALGPTYTVSESDLFPGYPASSPDVEPAAAETEDPELMHLGLFGLPDRVLHFGRAGLAHWLVP